MCRVHFHCQGPVTFTVHFLNTYVIQIYNEMLHFKIGYLYTLQTLYREGKLASL